MRQERSMHPVGCQCRPCLGGNPPRHKVGCKCVACTRAGGSLQKIGGKGTGSSPRLCITIKPRVRRWVIQKGGPKYIRKLIRRCQNEGIVPSSDSISRKPRSKKGRARKPVFVSLSEEALSYLNQAESPTMFLRAKIEEDYEEMFGEGSSER